MTLAVASRPAHRLGKGFDFAAAAPHRIDVHYHPIAPTWAAHPKVQKTIAPQLMEMVRTWTPEVAIAE